MLDDQVRSKSSLPRRGAPRESRRLRVLSAWLSESASPFPIPLTYSHSRAIILSVTYRLRHSPTTHAPAGAGRRLFQSRCDSALFGQESTPCAIPNAVTRTFSQLRNAAKCIILQPFSAKSTLASGFRPPHESSFRRPCLNPGGEVLVPRPLSSTGPGGVCYGARCQGAPDVVRHGTHAPLRFVTYGGIRDPLRATLRRRVV